jgi:DNA-binding NarL/FixJ family response regulator
MRQWEFAAVPPLRVVIADDHPFFRQGLAKQLARFDIDVVGQAANGWGAIEAAENTTPDVVVLDLNMPVLSGVDVIRRLAERAPMSRVLVLSVSADELDVTDAILAGAGGYVLKDGSVEDVVAGVRALARGESLISPRIAAMLLQRVREREQARTATLPTSLSPADVELLRLVAHRKTQDEIGAALGIDSGTLGTQLAAVLTTLQAEERARAAARAWRNGGL